MTSANDDDGPSPETAPTVADRATVPVQLAGRFGGGNGETVLRADLTKEALGAIIDKLLAYRNRTELPTALITIPDPDQPDQQRRIMVWRVVRVVGLPPVFGEHDALLYDRGRPVDRVADDNQPDAVLLPLTRAQLKSVLAGQPVRVDIPPPDPYSPPLVVIVRLKKET